jgi:glycosyltransferase involved in cell wall biosynthesis
MNVLHVCEAWRPVTTGNTTRSWERLAAQAEANLTPSVVVTSRQHSHGGGVPEKPEFVANLHAVEPSDRERRWRRWRPYWLDENHHANAITEAARAAGADVIHAHWSDAIGSAAATAARQLDLPYVAEVRFDLAGGVFSEGVLRLTGLGVVGGEALLRRYVERHLKGADHVVAASHTLGELVARSFPFVANRLSVIPNGLTPGRYTPGEPPTELVDKLGLGGKTVVGTTGTMYRYEGLDRLVWAVEQLMPIHPNLTLLFVGGGPRRAALEALCQKRGVPAVFHGPVDRAAMPEIYRLFDVFTVPRRSVSITRFAAPIKLTEAMASGRCCLATPTGDVPQLLADGRGTIASDIDLVTALAGLLDDPKRRQAQGQAAAAWASDTLSWSAGAAEDAAIYRKIRAGR